MTGAFTGRHMGHVTMGGDFFLGGSLGLTLTGGPRAARRASSCAISPLAGRQLRLAPASSCWPPAPAGASQFCSLDGRTVRGGVFVVVSIAKGEKARERFCLGAIRSDKISRKCRCDKISRDKRSKDVVVIRYLEINGIENNNGHKYALSYAQ